MSRGPSEPAVCRVLCPPTLLAACVSQWFACECKCVLLLDASKEQYVTESDCSWQLQVM